MRTWLLYVVDVGYVTDTLDDAVLFKLLCERPQRTEGFET